MRTVHGSLHLQLLGSPDSLVSWSWGWQLRIWSSSFGYRDTFPPHNPLYGYAPFEYHYLPLFTGAIKLGVDFVTALSLQKFVCSVLVWLACMLLPDLLLSNRQGADRVAYS